MWIEILCISLICILFSFFIWENYWANPHQPPGPWKFPMLGSLIQLSLADTTHYIGVDKLSKKYGKLMSLKIGQQDAVFISDFNTFKTIFSMEEAQGRRTIGTFLDRQFHNPNIGFAGSNGITWEETRKFSVEALRPYGFGNRRVIENRLEYELEFFYQVLDKLRAQDGNNYVYFTRPLFDPIIMNHMLSMLIGETMGHDSQIVQELIIANDTFTSNGVIGAGILTAFPFLRYVCPKTLGVDKQLEGIKMAHDITRVNVSFQGVNTSTFTKLIEARQKEGTYKTQPNCFIDEYLRKIETSSSPTFTFQSLQVAFMDLLQAGFETTSNSINYATLLIASHPEVQEALIDEINAVCGNSRNPSFSDRPQMPYTQALVTEIYRWSRIVVFGAVRAAAKDFKYDKYVVKKDTLLLPNFHSFFFDKGFWGDPENFRPKRFLDEQKNLIKNKVDMVAAFGFGKRNCFGEIIARDELFYYITNVFNKYKFSLPEGHPMPNLEPKMGITFGPHPYRLKVELRN